MTNLCPRCGAINAATNNFCGSCGMKTGSKSSNWLLWLLGGGTVVGLLLIIGALAILYSIGKEASRREGSSASRSSTQSTPTANKLSRQQLGDDWPFRVEEGTLDCEDMAVTFTAHGKTYAVNGTAKARKKYRPIEDIWADAPGGRGMKKDISPVIDRGLKFCR